MGTSKLLPFDEARAWLAQRVLSPGELKGPIPLYMADRHIFSAAADGMPRLIAFRFECHLEKPYLDEVDKEPSPIPSTVVRSLVAVPSFDCLELWLTNRTTAATIRSLGLLPPYRYPGVYWTSVAVWLSDLENLRRQLERKFGQNPPAARAGRKRELLAEHEQALKKETFRLLTLHVGLPHDDPEFNSKEKLIKKLQEFAGKKKLFEYKEPSRTSLQELIKIWLPEWESQQPAKN